LEQYSTDSENDAEDDDGFDLDNCSCTVKVTGMKGTTSSDALEFYFESKRAGGCEELDAVNFRFFKRVTEVAYNPVYLYQFST